MCGDGFSVGNRLYIYRTDATQQKAATRKLFGMGTVTTVATTER
jgi:hypothetical protein